MMKMCFVLVIFSQQLFKSVCKSVKIQYVQYVWVLVNIYAGEDAERTIS